MMLIINMERAMPLDNLLALIAVGMIVVTIAIAMGWVDKRSRGQ
jgi:hypothetical protein